MFMMQRTTTSVYDKAICEQKSWDAVRNWQCYCRNIKCIASARNWNIELDRKKLVFWQVQFQVLVNWKV